MTATRKGFRPPGLAGLHLPPELVCEIPDDLAQWVKRPAGHYYLPLLFDLAAGVTVNVLHYPNPGIIGRHVHDGPVYSYTIEGEWFYPEHDWVAKAGMFVWEPPGEIHTLTVKQSMMAFFVMHGGLTAVDDDDKPIAVENVLTLLEYCDQWYRDNGFGPEYVKKFIR